MKRLFATLGIGLALGMSAAFAFAPTAFAQFEPAPGTPEAAPAETPAAQAAVAAGQVPDPAAAQASANNKPTANTHASECSDNTFSCIIGAVMTYIASIFAWLVGVAMIVLDASVYYTVVHMGDILSKANGIAAIPLVWRIMRDFGNIALIFGFLAIGFEVILGVNFYGGGTKLLPKLVIVAVLLNFSLFFASAVVDVSNLFATQFYAQINNNAIPGPPTFDNFTTAVHEEGVSNKIMSQLGLQTLYGAAMDAGTAASTASKPQTIFTGNNAIYIGFLSSILFIVAAFVMFSLAFMLAARFVMLILLLVISPIGVAAFAIPKLKKRGSDWSSKLIQQAMTAPVLILLLYVALKVITDVHFLSSFMNGSSALAGNAWTGAAGVGTSSSNLTGFAGVLLSFIVAMGLLLAVTMASKSLSAVGAGFATKAAGMATFGAIAWGGRMTFGMAGTQLNSKKMQARAAGSGPGAFVARNLGVRFGRKLSNKTYDPRNIPGAGWVQKTMKVDAGKPSTLTAQKIYDNKVGKKWNVVTGWKPIQDKSKKEMEEFQAASRDLDLKKKIADAKQLDPTNRTGADALAQSALSKMSNKEIEELGDIRKGIDVLVRNLSPEQFESLLKSEKISETEKDEIRKARFKPLEASLKAGDAKAIGQWSAKDLAIAAPALLADTATKDSFAGLMSDSQYDSVVKNDRLTRTQQQQLREARGPATLKRYTDSDVYKDDSGSARPSTVPGRGDMTKGEFALSSLSTSARGKLAGTVLTVPPLAGSPPGTPPTSRDDVLDLFQAPDFEAVRRNGELTAEQRAAVGDYINRVLATHAIMGGPTPPRIANLQAIARQPAFKSYYNLP